MIAKSLHFIFGAAVFVVVCSTDALAGVRKMECREWRGGPAGDFLGSYVFFFDDTGTLNVIRKPEGQNNWLFGTNVKKWMLAWERNERAVFYGIDDDAMGPVKVLSLDFGNPKMFDYLLSGIAEDANSRSLTRKECHRLN